MRLDPEIDSLGSSVYFYQELLVTSSACFLPVPDIYRPHPKDGEGNVFSLSTLWGGGSGQSPAGGGVRSESSRGGVRSVQPGGGQVRAQPGGGVRSEPSRGGGQVSPAGGGVRSVQPGGGVRSAGGVSILRPIAGGMPLAFTQEDFLVFYFFILNNYNFYACMFAMMLVCLPNISQQNVKYTHNLSMAHRITHKH